VEERIIVLAPRGRDAEVIGKVLEKNQFIVHIVEHVNALIRAIEVGASAAIVAEEAIGPGDLTRLASWLEGQEPWSDFPFVVLVSKRGAVKRQADATFSDLGNIVLLERPVNVATLKTATVASIRGRQRQYQARDIMADSLRASESLRQSQAELLNLNEHLESRIRERTLALAQANDRLMNEAAELERVQKTLIHFQKMEAIGQLTGGIAHDFNNLLNVIQGNLDLINILSKDDAVKRRVDVAKRTCQRGAKLTGQLLAFSRNQRLNLAPIDVGQMFDEIRELVLTSIGAQISLQMSNEKDCCLVMADANQLEMALLNLAINARDAMPSGGELEFTARRAHTALDILPQGEYGVISVRDSGTGIPSAIIDKVFDPFFTTKEVGKGTGLGLSQVYGMAQQSGGMVQISSSAEGTLIDIWLKLAHSDGVAGSGRAPDRTALSYGQGTILVVDDDPAVAAAMVEMLEVLGYTVKAVNSAVLALEAVTLDCPDLMITDYLMPGLTGAQLVEQVNECQPNLPIIMVTGYADMHAIEKVLGKNKVLRKPFNLQELARAVADRLAEVKH